MPVDVAAQNGPGGGAAAVAARPSVNDIFDKRFKYLIIAPAVLILLLIGLFPLIYSLVVSFQRITMTETDTSFAGLENYIRLFQDERLWQAIWHTVVITGIALPVELVLDRKSVV